MKDDEIRGIENAFDRWFAGSDEMAQEMISGGLGCDYVRTLFDTVTNYDPAITPEFDAPWRTVQMILNIDSTDFFVTVIGWDGPRFVQQAMIVARDESTDYVVQSNGRMHFGLKNK